jgi:hypothetical protein
LDHFSFVLKKMSKLTVTLFLFTIIFVFSKRLILIDNVATWMSEEQINKLLLKKLDSDFNFMDITETPNLHKGAVPKASLKEYPQNPRRQKIMEKLTPNIQQKNLYQVVSDLSDFFNRYYLSETGIKASVWMREQFEKIISKLPSERRKLFKVQYFQHPRFPQRSVICKMEGKSMKEEIVIVGGHIDSLNAGNRTGLAPGAGKKKKKKLI